MFDIFLHRYYDLAEYPYHYLRVQRSAHTKELHEDWVRIPAWMMVLAR